MESLTCVVTIAVFTALMVNLELDDEQLEVILLSEQLIRVYNRIASSIGLTYQTISRLQTRDQSIGI